VPDSFQEEIRRPRAYPIEHRPVLPDLVSRIRDSSPHSPAGRPAWRRCSSLA